VHLQPDKALGLIAECANRFPGGQMLFALPPIPPERGLLFNTLLSTVNRVRLFDPLRPALTLLEFGRTQPNAVFR
jgi:hypothetical protein